MQKFYTKIPTTFMENKVASLRKIPQFLKCLKKQYQKC